VLKKLSGIIIVIAFSICALYVAGVEGRDLSQGVLRLHVIANSDDPADQALKLKVKDEIVKMMKQEFAGVEDANQARELASQDIDRIRLVAQEKVKSLGYDYPVEVYVGEFDFPTKSYGNMVFPAGKYQAVRVVIGEGQGKNWWCVLFPPLCLVSSSDKGMSLDSPDEAQVTFKCLELLPKGVKLVDR